MIYLKGKNKNDLKMIIRLMKKLKIKAIYTKEPITSASNNHEVFKIDCSKI